MVKQTINDLILKYENDFFSKDFCNIQENLENRLSKDFTEYGKSGTIHNRERTINALQSITQDRDIEITNFTLTQLSENTLLARYTSHHKNPNTQALRTSIWKQENKQWKLYFHQGTPQ